MTRCELFAYRLGNKPKYVTKSGTSSAKNSANAKNLS